MFTEIFQKLYEDALIEAERQAAVAEARLKDHKDLKMEEN